MALDAMRLECFIEMGETMIELSQSLNFVGGCLVHTSIECINNHDENMGAVADRMENVVRACKEQIRGFLEYLDDEVDD